MLPSASVKLAELPQPELFSACVAVLNTELLPLHYKELTSKAVAYLGFDEEHFQMYRVSEDVRQWLPGRKGNGVFYTGKPFYMMAKRSWFNTGQLMLGNFEEPVEIPGSAPSGIDGAFNALMRHPYMQDHFGGNIERRNRARSRGLVVEQHVSDWFKAKYPEFYKPPSNYGNWKQPCSEDFILDIDGHELKIDVAGSNSNGTYGGNKKSTDFHLLCDVHGHHVFWKAVTPGSKWGAHVMPETAMSPQRMLVWLNCAKHDVDYQMVKSKCV